MREIFNFDRKVLEHDYVTLKSYGDKYKLIYHNTPKGKKKKISERGTVNESKVDASISRARTKIFEYAYCNPWEYFVTLTIDPSRYNRYDLKGYYKKFGEWLRNYNSRNNIKIEYLLIPEMHKDNAWHMQGLMMGIPEEHLKINSHGYLDWDGYSKKFGYISLDKIKNREACSKYITKYVSKDMSAQNRDLNAKLYYNSRGLKTAETIKKGALAATNLLFDYENDYVKIKWIDDYDSAINLVHSINDIHPIDN